MRKHATALRAFTHADDSYEAKQVILGLEPGQFADWSAPGVDLVREATAAEVAAARGDKPAAARKPGRPRKAKAAAAIAADPVPDVTAPEA